MSNYEQVINQLKDAGASMRCKELTKLIESIGFTVRDGARGGHKIFSHDVINNFHSGSFNCDHGKNPEIKRPYINKVKKILQKYEEEICKYLENKNG